MFRPIPDRQNPGRILFEYDPDRDLVRVVQRKQEQLVDLREYQDSAAVGYNGVGEKRATNPDPLM